MVYDRNSLQAQKGKLGEKIVREILEEWVAEVTRPDGSTPDEENNSLVDFYAMPSERNLLFKTRYVEVKVRKAMPYAYGQYPCYSFPVVQIEAYRNFAREKNVQLDLWIVDPEANLILSGYLNDDDWLFNLHEKRFIDGKEFPFDQETKRGNMRFFHQKQFGGWWKINDAALAMLRGMDKRDDYDNDGGTFEYICEFVRESKPKEQVQQNKFAKPIDILTAPNGMNIDILTVDDNAHFFVKVARLSTAVGYKNPSISHHSPLIVAAKQFGITCYRFETQRLSGGDSYGTKGYYFTVSDVPKVLIQYCELHYNAKSGTRQAQFNEAAKELCDWFRRSVMMQYGS